VFTEAAGTYKGSPPLHSYRPTGKIAPGTGGGSDADHPMAYLVSAIKADPDCARSFRERGAVRYHAGDGCKVILAFRCNLAVGPGAEEAQQVKTAIGSYSAAVTPTQGVQRARCGRNPR